MQMCVGTLSLKMAAGSRQRRAESVRSIEDVFSVEDQLREISAVDEK